MEVLQILVCAVALSVIMFLLGFIAGSTMPESSPNAEVVKALRALLVDSSGWQIGHNSWTHQTGLTILHEPCHDKITCSGTISAVLRGAEYATVLRDIDRMQGMLLLRKGVGA